jgi:hypothetical protein
MNRQEKIEALAKEFCSEGFDHVDEVKEIILAGIAFRDEELLAMEFDEGIVCSTNDLPRNRLVVRVEDARKQHEQFIKAIKGQHG